MLNIQQLLDSKKCVNFSSYYEANSDSPLKLNSYSGYGNFVLNNNKEVQLYEFIETPFKYYFSGYEITEDEYYLLDENENNEGSLNVGRDDCNKWWGKTLDNYFPHPWYPNREIIGFQILRDIPLFITDAIYSVDDGCIHSEINYNSTYAVWECLEFPHFFKPLYNE